MGGSVEPEILRSSVAKSVFTGADVGQARPKRFELLTPDSGSAAGQVSKHPRRGIKRSTGAGSREIGKAESALAAYLNEKLTPRVKDSDPASIDIATVIAIYAEDGTRAGAICGAALQPTVGHGWIDPAEGIFNRRTAGMKKTKKRQPSIRMPPRLLSHVRRWVRLGIANDFLIEWNGEPVKRVNKAFRSARKAAGLGPEVTPHTLRHTAITWQAQLGVPPHEICGFFGITMDVFERVYGHHHPDYQAKAVNALSRFRQRPDRYTETEREQATANVIKLHRKH
ncbi:MAG TPA: tyrosine-type recombinase/integrase [Xanthobacteraceae bacterium]|nr:tyrosine-type recombinase/integrase [Xanthobacteraceae bacterium]